MATVNTEKLLSQILSVLSARQREIIEGRYGLKDGKPVTLAELGNSFGITRERVRQIEAGAMKDLGGFIKSGILGDFLKVVNDHIKNMGGARREALLLADLQLLLNESASPLFNNRVKFLLELSGCPKYRAEDDDFYSYWYQDASEQKRIGDFIVKLAKYMKTRKETVLSHASIDKVFNEAIKPHNLKDLVALNFISLSKKFHVNGFGNFGLSEWAEVNPKTIRDWAYAVLKKENKPLHFVEIAKSIEKYKAASKAINPQTVHNELIKDEKFVLVGRGIYGLQEHGYTPGTAKEVIARVLKQHGPLKPKELMDIVLKERVFKKNTIFINLQNKKHFKRLDDGKYTVNLA